MTYQQLRVIFFLFVTAGMSLAQVALNPTPTRSIGHPRQLPGFSVDTISPNLVEGREVFQPAGIALDTAATPPILYVSDTQNNRILAWQNAASFNNGKPADRVIGQLNPYSTTAYGPTTARATGLRSPTGLAVLAGDLYVVDSGNNRILRFRKPFELPADQPPAPDLVIGQTNVNTGRSPNGPNGAVTTQGIALTTNSTSYTGAITFDRNNNLWFTDAVNHRVLRYPSSAISGSNPPMPEADMELGQLDFTSVQATFVPGTDAGRRIANQLNVPTALAFDSSQRLYVADYNPADAANTTRVLVFEPPFTPGKSASRIMGVFPLQAQGGAPPTNQAVYSVRMADVQAIFFLPGSQGMGVVDAAFHRILLFDPYEQWPDAQTAFSPSAKAIIGHTSGLTGVNPADGKSLAGNDGSALASATTFNGPQAAVFFNNELFVADSYNNRIIVLPYTNTTFGAAYRVLGQDRYNTNSPNLIEGREFQFNNLISNSSPNAGVALDTTGDVPHLYVSDFYNHRILGYRDARKLRAGAPNDVADIVIGQPDMATAVCNYPAGDPNRPAQNTLCFPVGLVVDSAGNLYVADGGNGRVLRFPTPFAHVGNQAADLVLGQANFFTRITDPSSRNMSFPSGLAFAGSNGLLVSDLALNRVLYFPFSSGGTFSSADSGKAATKVFGQPDFTSSARGNSDNAMNAPQHLSTDTDGRPYVVDTGNSRVLIFDQINNNPATGAHATFQLTGLSNPYGINVNPVTGEIWVSELNQNQIRKYPKYDTVIFNQTYEKLAANLPLAVVQDQYGDMIVAEATNRVSFYFPGLAATNLAHGMPNFALAPNALTSVYALAGGSFGTETAVYSSTPLPKVLADTQVLFNGVPAPLYYVGPGQINIVVPWSAPATGTVDVQVVRVSTGQVLAAGSVPMNAVSPGIMVTSYSGASRQAAVINAKDNTVNSPTNPVSRGDYISIYGTGQGLVPNPPADGANPQSLIRTSFTPRVFIGACFVADCPAQAGESVPANPVDFSGLSPQYPGMWQINVRVPMATAPNSAAILFVMVNSIASTNQPVMGYNTVIYVK